MKRYICFCIALLLVVCCASCSNNDATQPTDNSASTSNTAPTDTQPTEPNVTLPTEPVYQPMLQWAEKEDVSFPELSDLFIDPQTGYVSTPFLIDTEVVQQSIALDPTITSVYPITNHSKSETITYEAGIPAVSYVETVSYKSEDGAISVAVTLERDATQYANCHKITIVFNGLTEASDQKTIENIAKNILGEYTEFAIYGADTDGLQYQYANSDNAQRGKLTQWGASSMSESIQRDGYQYYIIRKFSKAQKMLTLSIGVDRAEKTVVENAPINIGQTFNELPHGFGGVVAANFGVSDPLQTTEFANQMLAEYDDKYSATKIQRIYIKKQTNNNSNKYETYVQFGYSQTDGSINPAVFEMAMKYAIDDIGIITDADFGIVITGLTDKANGLENADETREEEFGKIVTMITKAFRYPNASKVHYTSKVPTVVSSFYANFLGHAFEQKLYVDYTESGITVRCNKNLVKELGR